jgi:type I restriction enzyme S subunit
VGKPEILYGSEIGSVKKLVEPDDILLSRIIPHIRRCWIVGLKNGRTQLASNEWIVFRSDKIEPRYLRHFLLSDLFHAQFMLTVAGVGGSLMRARSEGTGEILIPVPPLPEQRRIAQILDQSDRLRSLRCEALRQIARATQAIFIDMFGDPVSNTKNWTENLCLGDVADIASGITKGRKLNGHKTREVPYLAVLNVQDHALALDVVKTIEATEEEITRYRLEKDDLLLTEGGDPDKLGRGTLWNDELTDCIHQNHVFRVRLRSSNIHPVFLNWLIGSARGKRYFLRSAKQTTGIATINSTQLKEFPLLVPPFELQRLFATRLRAIDKLKILQRAHLAKLDTLIASLQHRAFRGEL